MIRQNASRSLSRSIMGLLAAVAFSGPLPAVDEPQKDKDEEARREQQLNNMQRSAAQYTLSSADTPERTFRFHETPALRPSNPVGGTPDGAPSPWPDHRRPPAIPQLSP